MTWDAYNRRKEPVLREVLAIADRRRDITVTSLLDTVDGGREASRHETELLLRLQMTLVPAPQRPAGRLQLTEGVDDPEIDRPSTPGAAAADHARRPRPARRQPRRPRSCARRSPRSWPSWRRPPACPDDHDLTRPRPTDPGLRSSRRLAAAPSTTERPTPSASGLMARCAAHSLPDRHRPPRSGAISLPRAPGGVASVRLGAARPPGVALGARTALSC